MKKTIFALCFLALSCILPTSCGDKAEQKPDSDLIISSDISNQDIRAFAEDSTGHVWIGTFRGLNKFDGHEYHQYFCNNDSTGLPDNHINDLLHDSSGRLWVATVNGVCQYTAKDTFKRIDIKTKNHNCLKIVETRDHRILIYNVLQILEYDPKGDCFVERLAGLDPYGMYTGSCFVSRDNQLWIASPTCLRSYDMEGFHLRDSIALGKVTFRYSLEGDDTLWLAGQGSLLRFSMTQKTFLPAISGIEKMIAKNNDMIDNVHSYDSHSLLVNTVNCGLMMHDSEVDTTVCQDSEMFPFEVPSTYITTLFTDSRGNLWIGTKDKGIKIINNHKGHFNNMEYINRTIGQQSVPAMSSDGRQYLWMATMAKGLYVYDLRTKRIANVDVPTLQEKKSNHITCLLADHNGQLWIGTKNAVLRCHYDGSMLILEKRWDIFMPMCMTRDRDGDMWVSTSSCYVFVFRKNADKPQSMQAYPNGFVFIPCINELSDGTMFLAAFNQKMLHINRKNLETSLVNVSNDDIRKCIKRSVFIPTSVCQDHCGNIWIGTICNGIMVYSPKTMQMRSIEGLSCSDITAIEEDKEGNMWISSMNGLNSYERNTGKVTRYYQRNGIVCNQFYDRSSCRLNDGTIIFGGTHGLTAFNPSEKIERHSIPLKLEYLKIHNDLVRPSENGAIKEILELSPGITIKSDQNSFGIKYSALDYGDLKPTHYQYCLEGFDKGWRDVGIEHTAYYANVPAGKYVFRVRTKEGGASASVNVTIKPSPYMSWWAYAIYALIGIIVVFYIVKVRRRIVAQTQATRKAELERQQEQRINRMNMSFFANISHEFRTPLTVIAGPVEQLTADTSLSKEASLLVASIRRSVNRMLRLVNQLMDFHKLENDTLKLKVTKTDVIEQLNQICNLFDYNMQSKGLTLLRQGIEDSITVWLDIDKFDKIMSNLLSNAVKFTPHGGKIAVEIDIDKIGNNQCLKITVTDNGSGIPEEHLENIFKKYYQVECPEQGAYNWGTGIGLYYARRLAELHHGSLTAANSSDTHGAVFTLLLPTEENAYLPSEKTESAPEQHLVYPLPFRQHDENGNDDTGRPTILIVDDDTEIIDYLHTLLSPYYNVRASFDAESALQAISERQPQIVLSDIVMPRINGYQLCRMIKDDILLCHIPVILVTAKSTAESQVEGLNMGADAYVTKPFDPHILLAQICSLLKNRERTRNVLTHATAANDTVKEVLSQQDKTFMEELYKLMEDELSNSELDIIHITDMLHISRTKFYYKIKGLTGETPATFFRTYKLNRAAQMLLTGKYNIAEVSDLTGFSTQSHFSNLFKKQFGMTPTEYKSPVNKG